MGESGTRALPAPASLADHHVTKLLEGPSSEKQALKLQSQVVT